MFGLESWMDCGRKEDQLIQLRVACWGIIRSWLGVCQLRRALTVEFESKIPHASVLTPIAFLRLLAYVPPYIMNICKNTL